MFNEKLIREFNALKTPFYYYDLGILGKTLASIKKHGISKGYHVHYALKANNNDPILKQIRKAGLGADCVSGKEIEKAAEAGFPPENIAFAGVGKSDEEIGIGLEHNIFSFNCESAEEVKVLNQFAGKYGKKARFALRINPAVEAGTHEYITTGTDENKFGIPIRLIPDLLDSIRNYENLQLTGIHFHIGSQIENLLAFQNLCRKINEVQTLFDTRSIGLQHINVGGGLGIDYCNPDTNAVPDFESYFAVFDEHLDLRKGRDLHFELGRSIVGQSGSLISRVLFTKQGLNSKFAILDAGMTELIRPALYQAKHQIDVLTSDKPEETYTVAGPICETSDTFRTNYSMPGVKRGDLVAIRSCGAYGQVMSSDFNLRERAEAYYSDRF